jgi:hypothetical protein
MDTHNMLIYLTPFRAVNMSRVSAWHFQCLCAGGRLLDVDPSWSKAVESRPFTLHIYMLEFLAVTREKFSSTTSFANQPH